MASYIAGGKGSQLLVKILTSGPGITPKVFGHPCSINAAREFALEANVNESRAIDCDDPEAPSWVKRTVESLSGSVTGSGVHHTPDWKPWRTWFESGEPKECQIVTNVADGDIEQGMFILSSLSKSGERGGEIESSITLQSDGPLVSADIE